MLFVADLTGKIAAAQGANVELAVAGALLHDVADAVMARKDPDHETRSLVLADELLRKCSFNKDDTEFIVNEIIKPHSRKDFTKKLFFDDIKQETATRYEALKLIFS